MKYNTFVSYATKDDAFVRELVQILEQHDIRCFFAPRDIKPGNVYAEEIINAIENAGCITLVLSEASNQSGYVLREINSAVLHSKNIIPFKIDQSDLSKPLQFYLGVDHWLTAYPNRTEKIQELINTIFQSETSSSGSIDTPRSVLYSTPTMINAAQAEDLGFSIERISMETIQLDYLSLEQNGFSLREELEGTAEDWLDMFCEYPDLYSLMMYKDKIIGYWLFELINESNYYAVINGNTMIDASMQELYELGGNFYCYVAIMPIIKPYANSANYMTLFRSLFDRLTNIRKNGTQISKIGVSVYAPLHERFIQKIGFTYVGNNVSNGKIYELDLQDLSSNPVVQTYFPSFYDAFTDTETN